MNEHSENFNKEVEGVRKYQLGVMELKNIITKLKTTLWGSIADLMKQEKKISQLEDKAWNSNRTAKMKNQKNSSKRKTTYYIQMTSHRCISRFFGRNFAGQKNWHFMFKRLKEKKILPSKNTLPDKVFHKWKMTQRNGKTFYAHGLENKYN